MAPGAAARRASTGDLINSRQNIGNPLKQFFEVHENRLKLLRKASVAPMMEGTHCRVESVTCRRACAPCVQPRCADTADLARPRHGKQRRAVVHRDRQQFGWQTWRCSELPHRLQRSANDSARIRPSVSSAPSDCDNHTNSDSRPATSALNAELLDVAAKFNATAGGGSVPIASRVTRGRLERWVIGCEIRRLGPFSAGRS
jgi:hypothetical protein